jgi:hypothetical protein
VFFSCDGVVNVVFLLAHLHASQRGARDSKSSIRLLPLIDDAKQIRGATPATTTKLTTPLSTRVQMCDSVHRDMADRILSFNLMRRRVCLRNCICDSRQRVLRLDCDKLRIVSCVV